MSGTGNDTIQFDNSIDGGEINLTTFVNDGAVGPTAFRDFENTTLVIDGQTGLSRGITIARSSATAFRLFYVAPTGNLTLQRLTLGGGLARGGNGASGGNYGGAGGGGAAGLGGAIYNQGTKSSTAL